MFTILTTELIRAINPSHPTPTELRVLVSLLNPNHTRPDCREAALRKLEEIAIKAQEGKSSFDCYSMHMKLIEIAQDLETTARATGVIDSILSFLDRMNRALIGPPLLQMVDVFLRKTGNHRLTAPQLREALWLYDLNSIPAFDHEGTVLDLGPPAVLKIEAKLMQVLLDPVRVPVGAFRELLGDIDRSIQAKARYWLEKREGQGPLSIRETGSLSDKASPENGDSGNG